MNGELFHLKRYLHETLGAKVVDRLSLCLSLKDYQDERVEAALEEMMKGPQG
jgi:hypothetical protein